MSQLIIRQIMNANQNDAENTANPNSEVSGSGNSACGVAFVNKETITIPGHFGALISDPIAMNLIRQDIRSWFLAYVPKWEDSFSPNNLDKSTEHFELLDDFFSGLVGEGIKRLKAGQR